MLDLFEVGRARPEATTPASAEANERRDVIVAIDAGHGGEDPGAGPRGLREKDVVLATPVALLRFSTPNPGSAAKWCAAVITTFPCVLERKRRAQGRRTCSFPSMRTPSYASAARRLGVCAIAARGHERDGSVACRVGESVGSHRGLGNLADRDRCWRSAPGYLHGQRDACPSTPAGACWRLWATPSVCTAESFISRASWYSSRRGCSVDPCRDRLYFESGGSA